MLDTINIFFYSENVINTNKFTSEKEKQANDAMWWKRPT